MKNTKEPQRVQRTQRAYNQSWTSISKEAEVAMKTQMMVLAALVGLASSPLIAGSGALNGASLSGKYVEARTAEVFTGGCIMGSEAETVGKQAVLAWKVDRGSFNGISLDGLSVVAAVAGDKNLGIQEIGGGQAKVSSPGFVDERATFHHSA